MFGYYYCYYYTLCTIKPTTSNLLLLYIRLPVYRNQSAAGFELFTNCTIENRHFRWSGQEQRNILIGKQYAKRRDFYDFHQSRFTDLQYLF